MCIRDSLVIFALLDSPRATGAYRFILRPGKDAVVDVQSKVFLRENVTKLGVAPLTSMFLYGSNQRSAKANYRRPCMTPTAWRSTPAATSTSGAR